MANPFRSAMAFLGLVEEDDYEEQPVAQSREVRETSQPREVREQRESRVAAAQASYQPVAAPQRATVTPMRRAQPHHKGAAAEMNEILTVHPRAFRDARTIAEHFRDGIPVIINISQMTDAEARRLIDFASGLAEALYGRIERVTGKVFLLSPAHVAVSGEQGDAASDEVDASFYAAN